jgi:hypothetical protein
MMPTISPELDTSFIKPRLRVFLSVDLIGSTQFKIQQTYADGTSDQTDDDAWWPNVLMAFYTDFQKEFLQNWREWVGVAETWSEVDVGDEPKLWKALGDELIFSKICIHMNEIWGLIQVWRKTINIFKQTWKYNALKCKSGAWLVGSPVRNWEVAFLRMPATDHEIEIMDDRQGYNFHLLGEYYKDNPRKIDIDFVGPNMDCGFRLLAKADERKFVISADLAYLLVLAHDDCFGKFKDMSYPTIEYYFDGVQELKGIDRYGVQYPIIWLDSYKLDIDGDIAKYARSVDELSDNNAVDLIKFRAFLETFLSEIAGFPEMPYIHNGNSDDGQFPSGHDDRIEKFRSVYRGAAVRLASLKASAEDPGTSGNEPTAAEESTITEFSIESPDDSLTS